MGSLKVVTQAGQPVGEVSLDPSIFDIEPNAAVMHQVVTAQLAARRAGTHNTKGRAEVRGGGAKPWRQKGTGRARHGSRRSPQWRGGGIAHGPKPRSYRQKTPKKMKRLALTSALSDRARSGDVIVVDAWSFAEPKTREAAAALDSIGASGKVLVVLADGDIAAHKSFRNLASTHCLNARQLNTHDVLVSDTIVFTRESLPVSDASAAGADSTASTFDSSSAGDSGSSNGEAQNA